MGQCRSKLDHHAAELLALRRAGANLAQLTRWLRFQRLAVLCIDDHGLHETKCVDPRHAVSATVTRLKLFQFDQSPSRQCFGCFFGQ